MNIKPSDFDKFYNNKNVIQAGIFDFVKDKISSKIGDNIFSPEKIDNWFDSSVKIVMNNLWPVLECYFKEANINVSKTEFEDYTINTKTILFGENEEINKGVKFNWFRLGHIIFILTITNLPKEKINNQNLTVEYLKDIEHKFINRIIKSGENKDKIKDDEFAELLAEILNN